MRETPVTKGDEKQDHFTRSGTMKTNAQLCVFIVLIGLHCTEQTLLNDRSVCGNPDITPNVDARIVGGVEAKAHSWPWQVSIMKYSESVWHHFCGGSLISPRWVITAAHCVLNNESDFKIVLGKHNLSAVEITEKVLHVEKKDIIKHHDYDNRTRDNDIALIPLSEDVSFNKHIKPICLPSVDVKVNKSCVTTGWGKTEEAQSGSSTVLNELILPVLNSIRCNQWNIHNGKVTENMICAGFFDGGNGSCYGDSGGPLTCHSGGRWELHGVVSTTFGKGCAWDRHPAVHTRVTRYVKWIQEKTEQIPSNQNVFESWISLPFIVTVIVVVVIWILFIIFRNVPRRIYRFFIPEHRPRRGPIHEE